MAMFIKPFKKKGFTLVETLVSLFLLILILSASATWGIDSLRFHVRQNRKTDSNLRVLQAFERMRSEIIFSKVLVLEPSRIQIEILPTHEKITWEINTGRIRRVAGSTAYYTLPEDPMVSLQFIKLAVNLIQINQDVVCLRNVL